VHPCLVSPGLACLILITKMAIGFVGTAQT
jgi:hypothetical protein